MKYCENCQALEKCEMYGGCWNPPAKERPASGGRRPSACSLLGDVIEAPGPYDVVRAHNSELWLVVDAHRDAILWTEQQLAADAAAEALNGMARLKALHDCMAPNGEQMGESVLSVAVGSAAVIGARLIMDIAPMTALFQTMPREELIRFDTRQITPEQWQITHHPLPDIE